MSTTSKIRCSYDCCRKKLGLMPLVCRCGAKFCSIHLPAEEHMCKYDYRGTNQKILVVNMPKCDSDKIEKI